MSLASKSIRLFRSLEPLHRASAQLLRQQYAREIVCGVRASSSITQKAVENEQGVKSQEQKTNVPTKESLLRIDWMMEHMTPRILKSRMKAFFDICKDDVIFEDKLYNYNIRQRSQLAMHIAKVRMYFRYLSPYNKVERIGSCVYEGEDVVVVLWRLSTLESSLSTYFLSLVGKKEPKINVSEGALDIHITPEGYIYKIVNRKITASDREGARAMEKLKEEGKKDLEHEEDRKFRKEMNEMM